MPQCSNTLRRANCNIVLTTALQQAQAKKAKAKVTNNPIQLPVAAAPSLYDYSALQKDVGFLGFGDKAKKAASKASSVAEDVKGNASSVADKASDVADKVNQRTVTAYARTHTTRFFGVLLCPALVRATAVKALCGAVCRVLTCLLTSHVRVRR